MPSSSPNRLPSAIEHALQRVRMAARTAAERTIDSLGLAALSSTNAYHRDGLLGAQYDLNRKLAIFALTFNESLDTSVAKEVLGTATAAQPHDTTMTDWGALALVDDHEVELRISADRFALEIAHACEWEIRELDGYIASLLGQVPGEATNNPLRAEVVGQALIRAVEAVAERPEVRKVLATEIGHSLGQALRQAYTEIAADLRDSGVRPIGLTVVQASRSGGARVSDGGRDSEAAELQAPTRPGPAGAAASDWNSLRGALGGATVRAGVGAHSTGGGLRSMGRVDPTMMSVIRRLHHGAPGDAGGFGWAAEAAGMAGFADHGAGAVPNLIHVHREELHDAARNGLDQMVIDVVAALFDQILADPKVPPQVARLIARLQLPVLRAALGDPAFFSSRRHPVRRLVNRIASLGTATDDFDGAEGQALLGRMQTLVQQIVDGDFEQIEIYDRTVAALETFVAAQAKARLDDQDEAGAVLARKEQQLRVQQRFAAQLQGALADLPMPGWLREFLAQVWSRVIATAEHEHGHDGAPARRMREAGRALVLSVQPKGAPAQRKAFLQQLPQLMKDLNHGMDRVRWPDEARREFFAKLLPAHAESLKGQPISTLEHNLLAAQADSALATPLPQAAALPPAPTTPPAQGLEPADAPVIFTPAEAKQVGLVDEASVDWRRAVDIDLSVEPELSAADLCIQGLPEPTEAAEPTRGRSLADHVQLGFAYRMHLEGLWRKVRLAHVSSGRTFFVFSHGAKQRETVSMTYRMLSRMCESGRLRAFENAYLLERATARARKQLATLGGTAASTPAPTHG